MGKIITLLMVLGLVLAIPMMTGKGFGDFSFVMPDLGTPMDLVDDTVSIGSVVTDKEVKVYKWYDDKGVQHFSNEPPPDMKDVDVVKLSPDTNVIKAIAVPKAEETKGTGGGPRSVVVGSPYSPGNIKDTINGAKGLSESIAQQQAAQKQMIDELMGKK